MSKNATRDLIIGTPRKIGEAVTDLEGRVPGWVFAVTADNLPDDFPALGIAQSADPRGYLQDLRKDKRSNIGLRLRDLEEKGVSVRIRLLHEVRMRPGARYSPELKAYRKMWSRQMATSVKTTMETPEETSHVTI